MKTSIFVASLLALASSGLAQNAAPSRPKIPHSHHADHGGQVLMFGDDHIEFVAEPNSTQVTFYASDKMRTPVALQSLTIAVEIVDGTKVTPLKVTPSAKAPNVGLLIVPRPAQKTGVLKVQAYRETPPKGHVSVKSAQSLPLSQLFK